MRLKTIFVTFSLLVSRFIRREKKMRESVSNDDQEREREREREF